jgi:hypothetical protein
MKFKEMSQGVVRSSLIILSCLGAGDARPAEAQLGLRSLLPLGSEHTALRRAAMGARLRLEQADCQEVFAEFQDASGRTLQANLDAQGRSAANYLSLIVFADGGRLRRCQDSNTFAVTEPGSRVVHLCGQQFASVATNNPRLAEAFLIHEELHSLGLGENPPSPQEITARVLASCHP